MSTPTSTQRLTDALHDVHRVMRNVVESWTADKDAHRTEQAMCAIHGLVSIEDSIEQVICELHLAAVATENANDSEVRCTVPRTSGADESSVGDVREAEAEHLRGLARALQSKARPE